MSSRTTSRPSSYLQWYAYHWLKSTVLCNKNNCAAFGCGHSRHVALSAIQCGNSRPSIDDGTNSEMWSFFRIMARSNYEEN
jgi:hypothetical protein